MTYYTPGLGKSKPFLRNERVPEMCIFRRVPVTALRYRDLREMAAVRSGYPEVDRRILNAEMGHRFYAEMMGAAPSRKGGQ